MTPKYASNYGSKAPIFRSRLASNSRARATIYQELLEPTEQQNVLPEKCDCGCSTIIANSLQPYYTHQVIELPEVKMDILHLILNKGKCRNKKWVCLRQTCLAHLIRKAKALSEAKDKLSQDFGEKILKELQPLCHWAKAPPDHDQWCEFYQRFIDLIFDHQQQKNEAGALARSLIRQIDSLWVFLEVSGVEPTNNHAMKPVP